MTFERDIETRLDSASWSETIAGSVIKKDKRRRVITRAGLSSIVAVFVAVVGLNTLALNNYTLDSIIDDEAALFVSSEVIDLEMF